MTMDDQPVENPAVSAQTTDSDVQVDAQEERELLTFRDRSDGFWKWFGRHEAKLEELTGDRKQAMGEEATALLDKGAAWLGGGVTLTLSGRCALTLEVGGDDIWYYLLPWLAARIPEEYAQKWKIHAGRPGSHGRDITVERETLRLDASEILVCLEYNDASKRFTVCFYNDTLSNRAEDVALDAFKELLEAVLGETALYLYIGGTRRLDERSKGMVPLNELEKALGEALHEKGRDSFVRADQYVTVYEREPEDNEELRYDVLVGSTCWPGLLEEYYADTPLRWQRLEDRGAIACFLAFAYDGELEPMLEVRHELEQRLENEVLGLRGSGSELGLVLGGAVGTQCVYIDLLLYDEPAFAEKAPALLVSYPYDIYISDFRQRCDLEELTGQGRG